MGLALKDIARAMHHLPQVLVCAVEREEAIIPKGNFVFKEGDRVLRCPMWPPSPPFSAPWAKRW